MDATYCDIHCPEISGRSVLSAATGFLSVKPVSAKGTDVTETGVCFGHSRMFSEMRQDIRLWILKDKGGS